MHRTPYALLCLGCLLAVAALASAGEEKKQDKKPKPKITVGKETTLITEPVDADGYIDYAKALNQAMSKGITAKNNAYVLLTKAFGPHPEGANLPAEFYTWLGIRPPPEKGQYLVSFSQFIKDHPEFAAEQDNAADVHKVLDEATQKRWTAKEKPAVAAWLKANEKPLAMAVEATKRPEYFHPLVPGRTKDGTSDGLITSLVPGVQKCRDVATALIVRAMLALGEGRHEDAWNDLLACHRLGRLVGRGGTLIEFLVGVAIESIAAEGDLAMLESPKLNSPLIITRLRDLEQLPPRSKVADKVDLCERYTFLEMVEMVARHGPEFLERMSGGKPSRPANPLLKAAFANIDWNPALRNGNRAFDRMVAAMRHNGYAERVKALDEFERDLRQLRNDITKPGIGNFLQNIFMSPTERGKRIGDILLTLLIPAVSKVQQAGERIDQQEQNLRIAFALAAYQRDNGSYPPTLDALAPRYLPQVPIDRFSGKALTYRTEDAGYFMYSVGVNGKDEGGRGYDDDPRGDDLVVRVPRR